MTDVQAIVAFSGTAGLLTITPGLDTALVLRTAAVEGRQQAFLAGIGICSGCLTWGFGASVGIAALVSVSRIAYIGVRTVGALYLVFLGVRMLRSDGGSDQGAVSNSPGWKLDGNRGARWFVRGYFTNILNPKVGLFYVTFLPQFIPPSASVIWFSILLAVIHAAEGLMWFLLLAFATGLFARWLSRPATARILDRATGSVLIGFAVCLLAGER